MIVSLSAVPELKCSNYSSLAIFCLLTLELMTSGTAIKNKPNPLILIINIKRFR